MGRPFPWFEFSVGLRLERQPSYVFSVVAAQATERGLQSAGVLVSEGPVLRSNTAETERSLRQEGVSWVADCDAVGSGIFSLVPITFHTLGGVVLLINRKS